MAYNSTIVFDTASGLLSGTLTGAPPTPPTIASVEPVSDVVISGYADGSTTYFAQGRSRGDGSWALSTAALAAGMHAIAITVDYGLTAGAKTILVLRAGGAVVDPMRCGQLTNASPRS